MKKKIGVGIIGTGLRGTQVIAPRIVELREEISLEVRALCDRLPLRAAESRDQIKSLYERSGHAPQIKIHDHYQALINDADIDLIIITSPTYCHKDHAIAALESGKHVYLDKPIEVSLQAAKEILDAERKKRNPLIMGFTRRYEASWKKAFELFENDRIGNLKMMQIRSIIPYTRYYHLWHRRNELSGGALNDKSSHHMDVFNWFSQSSATRISAFGGYSGLFPEDPDAPEFCADCSRRCDFNFYQDYQLKELNMPQIPQSYKSGMDEQARLDNCVYKSGADILDHLTAQIFYKNGVMASLMLCIFGPEAPDQETLELIGDGGRIHLTRSTGEIEIYSEQGRIHEVIDVKDDEFSSSHFGADLQLVRELDSFCAGQPPRACAQDGYESLRMIHGIYQSVSQNGTCVNAQDIMDVDMKRFRDQMNKKVA